MKCRFIFGPKKKWRYYYITHSYWFANNRTRTEELVRQNEPLFSQLIGSTGMVQVRIDKSMKETRQSLTAEIRPPCQSFRKFQGNNNGPHLKWFVRIYRKFGTYFCWWACLAVINEKYKESTHRKRVAELRPIYRLR